MSIKRTRHRWRKNDDLKLLEIIQENEKVMTVEEASHIASNVLTNVGVKVTPAACSARFYAIKANKIAPYPGMRRRVEKVKISSTEKYSIVHKVEVYVNNDKRVSFLFDQKEVKEIKEKRGQHLFKDVDIKTLNSILKNDELFKTISFLRGNEL